MSDDVKQHNGRPTVRTPEVAAKIVAAIELGASMTSAAAAARVSSSLIRRWRQESDEFADQLELARSNFERRMLQKIHAASDIDWKAASWLLQKCLPEVYENRQPFQGRVEITGPNGGPIEMQSLDQKLDLLTTDQLRALAGGVPIEALQGDDVAEIIEHDPDA